MVKNGTALPARPHWLRCTLPSGNGREGERDSPENVGEDVDEVSAMATGRLEDAQDDGEGLGTGVGAVASAAVLAIGGRQSHLVFGRPIGGRKT